MSILFKIGALLLFCQTWNSVSGNTVELTESHGSFWSRDFPKPYSDRSEVRYWRIRVPNRDHKVFLRFTTFDTKSTDTVMVYDSDMNYDSYLIRQISGNITKGHSNLDFVSSSNVMLVRFYTSSSGYGNGFLAQYYSGTGDHLLTNPEGTFSPSSYPSNYSDNELIQWTIRPTGKYTMLNLHIGPLDLEECCDSLEIRTSDKILGTYSSANPPPSIIHITNDILRVTFASDSSTTAKGFSAKYNMGRHHYLYNNVGEFKSRHYPSNYPSIHTEYWTIQVKDPEKAKIHLNFKDFITEGTKDTLQIFDGSDESAPLIATLSGTTYSGRHYLSSGEFLFLKFITDEQSEDRGFLVRYEAVPDDYQI